MKKEDCHSPCIGLACYSCQHHHDKRFEKAGPTVSVIVGSSKQQTTAADILANMADTYRERNKVYGDNYKMVAKLMQVLFPKGVPPELVVTDQFHLFELKLVKLSRFAISNLTHLDSIHDDAVYAAMIEAILHNNMKEKAA